jgi:pimeloyl-ACP methyl ester carboxylesterase
VFVTALSHQRALGELPHDSERLTLHGADSSLDALALRPDPSRDTGFWILHLHGNADTAFSQQQLEHVAALRDLGFAVLALDYRGFGRSPGVASEAHMDQDAETGYQALIARGVAPERIILWGHSLGSGPAVWLATRERAAALVLFGVFTSIPDAAQDQYPYLPVHWLVGVQFDSRSLIARVHMPVLIAHSVADRLIPYHHSLALFAAAHEPKRLLLLRGPSNDGLGGHADALYQHCEALAPALSALIGAPVRCP